MTELQLTEIRNYLLSKKLPIDIVVELNDHFISQINDLQRAKNLSFEEAFERTKLSWDKELKPYWKGDWDLEDKSELLRRINRSNFNLLFKKSAIFTFSIIILLLICSIIVDFEIYKYLYVILVGIVIIKPLVNYYKHRKDFTLPKKYSKHILISIQEYTLLSMGGLYFYFRFFFDGFTIAKMFKDFFNIQNFENFIFGFIITFALLKFSFLSIFSQKIYLEKIQKIKPFLKYL